MKSINISLNTIEKVKCFVNIIEAHEGNFDLASDRFVVDAKSIMGIFSLNLGKPLKLEVHDDAEIENIRTVLKDFII